MLMYIWQHTSTNTHLHLLIALKSSHKSNIKLWAQLFKNTYSKKHIHCPLGLTMCTTLMFRGCWSIRAVSRFASNPFTLIITYLTAAGAGLTPPPQPPPLPSTVRKRNHNNTFLVSTRPCNLKFGHGVLRIRSCVLLFFFRAVDRYDIIK